jgi:PKD repeat protein
MGIQWNWDFGDGTLTSPTSLPVTHSWSTKGFYTISVYSYNMMNSQNGTLLVWVIDPITTMDVTGCPCATGVVQNFIFTVANGSDYVCYWDMGDGTAGATFTTNSTSTPSGSAVPYTYATAGTYSMTVSCSNNISGPIVFTTSNVVQDTTTILQTVATSDVTITSTPFAVTTVTPSLSLFSLHTNAPVAFVNSQADFSAWFTSTAPLAPGLTVSFDYGDGIFTPPMSLALSQKYTHTYKSMGSYTVKASLNSGFTTQVYTATVSCIEPVANIYTLVSPPIAVVGSPVTFSLGMYSGANVTLYVDYGDNGPITVLSRKG